MPISRAVPTGFASNSMWLRLDKAAMPPERELFDPAERGRRLVGEGPSSATSASTCSATGQRLTLRPCTGCSAFAFASSVRNIPSRSAAGVVLHAEWPNVSTFSDLHADYDMLFGIGLRSWMRHRELYPTTESFHDVDGTPRRQSRTTASRTACLGRIGRFSQTYTT